jgi:hypothetical protein
VTFLVPILVAVVGLVILAAALVLGSKVRAQEKESVQTGKQIMSLAGQIKEAADARQMEPYVNAYAKDANAIENLMKGTTLRELLSYRIFPDTNERTTLLFEEFASHYLSGMDAMLQSVKAGTAPTLSEINAAMRKAPQAGAGMYGGLYGGNAYARDDMMANVGMGSSMYGPGQSQISTALMSPAQRKIFDSTCTDKARSAGVYASPVNTAGYVYWTDWKFANRDAAYRDCWYWQLGYWIIEDVMTTIREMNKGSDNILDAPVKRLMNVNFALGRTGGRGMRRIGRPTRGEKTGDNPTYVTSARDAMTMPCTGRYCNDQVDVVQFEVRVVVEAKAAMAFMKQLCAAKPHQFNGWKNEGPLQKLQHNQITILESSTVPIAPDNPEHVVYRYGDAPAVELDLICEYLFDKPAYEYPKPQQVKDDIVSAAESGTKKR